MTVAGAHPLDDRPVAGVTAGAVRGFDQRPAQVVRIEFLKRLYSDRHGIYKKSPAPLDGDVHVFGVGLDGQIRQYPKIRTQAKTLRPARPGRG